MLSMIVISLDAQQEYLVVNYKNINAYLFLTKHLNESILLFTKNRYFSR